jgi:hypothetical protein
MRLISRNIFSLGTITINDPLLKALNDYLLRNKDMTWPDSYPQSYERIGEETKGPKLLRRRASVWYV